MDKKKIIIIASIVAAVILAVAAVFITLALLPSDNPPGGDRSEAGVYYSPSGKECELTLKENGEFTLVYDGSSATGVYLLDGAALTLDFAAEGIDSITATYENEIVELTYKGAAMRLLKKVDYTVKFETNGGTNVADVLVTNGKTVSKPADPTKSGYVFVGWYKDSEFTTPFTFSSDIVTSHITIYARWVETTGTEERIISFNLGYAEGTVPTPKPTLGGRLFDAPVVKREGYTFGGWWISTDNDAQRLSYKWTEDIVFKADTQLFAVWYEDGSTRVEAPSLKIDDAGISWNSVTGARSYEVKVEDSNGTVIISRAVSVTNVKIAFADYAPGVYKISVIANANTGDEDNSKSYYTYVNKGLDKVSGMFVSGNSTLVFNGVDNAQKYLITVVCGNKDHNHTDYDNGSSKTFSFVNCPMPTDGIKFTVKAVADGYFTSISDTFTYKKELDAVSGLEWNEQTGTVSWNTVENAEYYMVSVTCGNQKHVHTLRSNGNKTSIDIKECSNVSGGVTIKVYPVADGYAPSTSAEIKVNKTSLKTPGGITLTGTVLGWNEDADASKYEISVNGTAYESSVNSFDLASVIGDESGALYEIKIRARGSSDSLWSNTIKCYTNALNGAPRYSNNTLFWDYAIGAEYYEVQVNDGDIKKISGANYAKISLVCQGENVIKLRFVKGDNRSEWTRVSVEAFAVTFDTIGGSLVEKQFVSTGDAISLPKPTKAGYKFESWYNVPGGPMANGKEIIAESLKMTENVILYAHYIPERYEVIYNYGLGGTGLGVNGTVEYERDYTLEIPTANEITVSFGGWFSSPYGKGTQYTDGTGKSLNPWNIVGGGEVYAFWIDETLVFEAVKVNGKDAYAVSAGPKVALISEVTVPATYNGLPVAMVKGGAFERCTTLKTINLPATIEIISNIDPFADCNSLENINVYLVDGYLSPKYSSEGGVLFENKSEGKALIRMPAGREGGYVIPDGVTEISECAFIESSIQSVVVSADVAKIANDAFYGSRGLCDISFAVSDTGENTELTIGKRAFAYCTALVRIILPERLTFIELSKFHEDSTGKFAVSEDYAFVGCTALESIGVDSGSSDYKVIGGMIYSADGKELIYCPDAKSGAVTVPTGTQFIGDGAFVGCSGITEIFIPSSVTYIGENAFRALPINKVVFGGKGFSSVTIGDYSFADCKALSSVTFGQGSRISVIGKGAFSGCKALSDFTITSSVSEIRNNAFENCVGLETVTFEGGKTALEFGTNVFYNCTKLTSVQIPANVTEIPGIFTGCTSLTEVKVDSGNQKFVSVGGVVFSKDRTEIVYFPQGKGGSYTIPAAVTSIAAGVFRGNNSLELLAIPNTVSYIGEEAFKGTHIDNIVFIGDKHADELVIAKSAFEKAYFEGYDFKLPSHTKHIGDYAFSGIFYQKIVLNEGLESIGNYAFYHPNNDNGADVLIPSSVVSIGEYCFSGVTVSDSYHTAHHFVGAVFSVENPHLTTIGDYAFYKNTKIASVTLPSTVKTIGNYAFYQCQNLTSVTLSASLETIGAYAFAASANAYLVPISAITIPEGVSYVGARAFENCQLLTTVTFEGTVNSPELVLGSAYRRRYESDGVEMFSVERGNVFASCTRLSTVTLSANITALGDYCFTNAGGSEFKVVIPADSKLATIGAFCFYKSRLDSFTVPASVRNLPPIEELGLLYNRLGIGDYAFASTATKLTSFTFLKDSNSYPLTIGYGAFENQTALSSIELPARLTTYLSANGEVIAPLADGPLAFYGMSLLSEITAESGCPYKVVGGVLYTADMTELVFCPASLSGEVSVPSTVTKIHPRAFLNCGKITSVSFASNSALTAIGDFAFYNCKSIKNVVLPSGVVSVGEGAFCNALALESLTLSKSLASFDVSTLDGCASLKTVFVELGNGSFSSDGGVLYNLNKTGLVLYPVGRTDISYTVKNSVVSIGKRAFFGNTALEAVILPAGLLEINDSAFENCASLKTVVIPASVEIIGDSAFAGSVSAESISFDFGGSNKIVIGDGAFKNCGAGAIILPARLSAIGAEAFFASKISSLAFESSDVYQLTEIGNKAFYATRLEKVIFPSGVTVVGEGAFSDTTELLEITFGEGLETIGAEAFKNSSVKTVKLPRSLKNLGAAAFYNCESLEMVSFASGSQLQAVAEGTFFGCTSLESITIPTFVKEIGGTDNNGAFYNCTSLKTVIFESDDFCSVIGDFAFYGCNSVTEFDIPLTVGTLGKYAFSGCTALEKITLHRATIKLGEGLFSGCTALYDVGMDTGTDKLPANMFENCESLSYIFIPATVSEIGEKCFLGTGIEGFDVSKESKTLVSVSGIVYNSSKTQIVCFPPKFKTKTLIIPKEVVSISNSNFQYCDGLKEVIFEEGGTSPLSIGNYAFDGCYQLRRVSLPERLVSIGSYAFRECYALNSIRIPKNVKSIGDRAFTKCGTLFDVCNESSIQNITKNTSIDYVSVDPLVGGKVNIYTPTEGAPVIYREGEFVFTNVNGAKRLIGYEGDSGVVTLPDGTYEVTSYMFCNNTSLTKLIVPEGVSLSGSFIFSGCTNLEVILSKGRIPEAWSSVWNSGIPAFAGYTGENNTYTFVTGEAAPIAPITTSDVIALPTPELENYVFLGWYDNEELTGEPLSDVYYSSEKTTLYASFMEEDEYIERYLRGQSMEYAYSISGSGTYNVDIRSKGTQNYFVLTVSAGEIWNISTPTGYKYHKLCIYDESGKVLLTYTSAIVDPNFELNYDYTFEKGGTYYIGLGYKDPKANPGSYPVTFTKK